MVDVKVSVVIPIYNIQDYLKQCLDSIINQTLEEIEIICVDDGSTDGSLQILEEYALNDGRIKIIKQENSGCAVARETGLKQASGEYFAFVDADDWLELDALEKIYENALSNNSDLVLFHICRYDQGKEIFYKSGSNIEDYFNDDTIDYNNFTFNYKSIKPFLLNSSFAVWFKLYRTEFMRSYDDFFFPKFMNFEDVPLHVQIMIRAEKISFCPGKFYNYRTSNIDSLTNSVYTNERIFDIFDIVKHVENILIENDILNEFRHEFTRFKISQLNYWFRKSNELHKEKLFKCIKQNFEAMNLDDELNLLNRNMQTIYSNILATNSYGELALLEEKFDLEEKLKQQELYYSNQIKNQNQNFERKLNEQKIILKNTIKNYEKTVENQKTRYETEINQHLKMIESMQLRHTKDISQIKGLQTDLDRIKDQVKQILNTKPYRLAYFLRRFSHEFVKGDMTHKTDFLGWILTKFTRKKSDKDFRYNPLAELIQK